MNTVVRVQVRRAVVRVQVGLLPSSDSGEDPWTYLLLAQDTADLTGALVAAGGLSFAPAANKQYEVEARLIFTSANVNTGLQWTFSAPGGASWAAQSIQVPSSVVSMAQRHGQLDVAVLGAGVTSTVVQYLALGSCVLKMGANPSGSLSVLFNTETPAVAVTLLAGSYIRYREISAS